MSGGDLCDIDKTITQRRSGVTSWDVKELHDDGRDRDCYAMSGRCCWRQQGMQRWEIAVK